MYYTKKSYKDELRDILCSINEDELDRIIQNFFAHFIDEYSDIMLNEANETECNLDYLSVYNIDETTKNIENLLGQLIEKHHVIDGSSYQFLRLFIYSIHNDRNAYSFCLNCQNCSVSDNCNKLFLQRLATKKCREMSGFREIFIDILTDYLVNEKADLNNSTIS